MPIPDLSLPVCSDPGNPTVCGGVSACRMATPDSGRCIDCNAAGTCEGLITKPCSLAADCDVDLQCFRGTCVLVCGLPHGPECGAPDHCIDVGYANDRGLCDPAYLQ